MAATTIGGAKTGYIGSSVACLALPDRIPALWGTAASQERPFREHSNRSAHPVGAVVAEWARDVEPHRISRPLLANSSTLTSPEPVVARQDR